MQITYTESPDSFPYHMQNDRAQLSQTFALQHQLFEVTEILREYPKPQPSGGKKTDNTQ